MRVLITGASGLIGGRLLEHMSDADVRIRAASRVPRSWPQGVEGCVVDFGRPSTLREACLGVDSLVNLASMPANIAEGQPREALLSHGGGTLSLVEAATSEGVTYFVQVSTSKVYGTNLAGVVTEQTIPRPQSHYAILHALVENYVSSLHPNSVILRLANGFGVPGSSDVACWDLIVNQMCRQVVQETQIEIRSSGESWRNFISMGDVVEALRLAATGEIRSDLYNLGASSSMRLKTMAELVAEVSRDTLGIDPSITVGPCSGESPPPELDYCVDKLNQAGFSPGHQIEDEIRETLLMAQRIHSLEVDWE